MKNRSLLFIPAKEKTLAKIGQVDADIYIIDLEDSIEDQNKAAALQGTISVLNDLSSASLSQIYVRLNKSMFESEAMKLARYDGIGFMLPKFEEPREYQILSEVWMSHPVIALIETPKGLINIQETASCNWIDGIAFGAEDYTATVNMENTIQRLIYQKSMIVTFSKAFGKKVFDTPSFQLNDAVKIDEEARDAVAMGFDGKLAIHPKQVAIINQAFSSMDIEYLEEIVSAYERQNEAVFVYDGRPYEKMHIARFMRIIKENGGM